MSLDLIRELWGYHHWANRRLFDVTAALGEEVAARELGPQWSAPTLGGLFNHLYGADRWWLERWKGVPQSASWVADIYYGDAVLALGELRRRWDDLEAEQRRFVGAVAEADLGRLVEGTTRFGKTFRRPLGMLLLHVPNHATHHRSEIATMLTMVSGSPPDTGINTYLNEREARG
jgi:uncharacterized damage-inducible protein DinB